MSREKVIQAVENLSVRRGGNVISKKELVSQDKSTICVFIGLGGLGGRAVNEIKSLADERMVDADKRFYLAIDTCLSDMKKLKKIDLDAEIKEMNPDGEKAEEGPKSRGCLLTSEMIELYDPAKPFKLSEADENMKQWLRYDLFKEVSIKGDGAQAKRQIGRVMLFANDNYSRVKLEVKKVLEKANQQRKDSKANNVRVYIIAGVSGGTGSGTIIDISYMIRNIIKVIDANTFDVVGCIFTPDAQMNDEGIYGVEEKELSLQNNFYAAMKEIDYFYNNKERRKQYISPKKSEPARDENIFDECRLIGGKSSNGVLICKDSSEVIQKLAQAIMYEIANVESDAESKFTYKAYCSNIPDAVRRWRDTDKAKGMALPDWAPPRYSAFGYGSFYIPKNELFAYCAHKLLERLREQWNAQDISEKELESKVRSVSLTDGRLFAAKLFELGGVGSDFEIDKRHVPVDPFLPGPVANVDKYIADLDDVIRAVSAPTNINRYLRNARGTNNSKLKENFTNPIIEMVDAAFTSTDPKKPARGPAYAINLLSGAIGTPTWMHYSGEGVLKKLKRIIDELNTDVNNWRTELQLVHDELLEDAAKLKTFQVGQHDAGAIQSFIDGYANYAKDAVNATLLANSAEYLNDIYTILLEKNHELFEIYATTVEYIWQVLKKDSEYMLDTNRKKEGNLTTFTFDVTNFDEKDEKSTRILKFFDGVVDGKDLAVQSKKFTDMVFVELKKEVEAQNGVITSEKVEEILHGYFKNAFSEWVKDAVEKFCYIAYTDKEVTPEQVTAIFEDKELRSEALKEVASDIREKLFEKAKVLLTSADEERNIENFTNYTAVGMIQETENINSQIDVTMKTTMQKGWSEFVMYKGICGVPLFLLGGLRDYKKIYDGGEKGEIVAGVHMDEVGDNWRDFPELYTYPAAKVLEEYTDLPSEVTKADKEKHVAILKNAIAAKEMGILKQVQETDDFYTLYYKLVNALVDDEQTVYDKLKNAYDASESKGDFLAVISDAGYKVSDDEAIAIKWDAIKPDYDIIRNKMDIGNETDIGNCIKLIYSNIEWVANLKSALENFELLYKTYCKVVEDSAASDVYATKLVDLYNGIRFGLVTMPNAETVELKYGAAEERKITLAVKPVWQEIDKAVLLYHFFVQSMLTMDDTIYKAFKEYLDLTIAKAATTPDITPVLKHILGAISHPQYLGESISTARRDNFRVELEVTTMRYDMPKPVGAMKSDEEIDAVVANLNDFYITLKTRFKKQIEEMAQAADETEE